MNVTYENNKIVIENVPAETGKKILGFIYGTLNKKILPRPVIRDKNDKLVKDYSLREWYLKLQEEIFEAFEDKEYINHYEIADIITVCISYLNAIGYNENGRSEIFAAVNEKNEKRGYFKESD